MIGHCSYSATKVPLREREDGSHISRSIGNWVKGRATLLLYAVCRTDSSGQMNQVGPLRFALDLDLHALMLEVPVAFSN